MRKAASDWIARRDSGLSADEEASFLAWRDANPRHAEAVARYEKLWSHLDRPRAAGFSAQINRDLTLLQERDRRRRGRLVGTSGLAVAILAGAWWSYRPTRLEPIATSAQTAVILPERRVLVDGTVVEHPAGSVVNVDFSSPHFRRVVLARGEAHFQVAKNPNRPFIVRVAHLEVQAVGTAFTVQLASSSVEVVVTEGRVAIAADAARTTDQGPDRDLEPGPFAVSKTAAIEVDAGQKVALALEAGVQAAPPQVERISPREMAERFAWRNPRMEFSDTPLNDVAAAINRYAAERGGIQFTVEDPAVGQARFSGIFRVDDERAFVGILEKGFGIEAERVGEQRIVLRKAR